MSFMIVISILHAIIVIVIVLTPVTLNKSEVCVLRLFTIIWFHYPVWYPVLCFFST